MAPTGALFERVVSTLLAVVDVDVLVEVLVAVFWDVLEDKVIRDEPATTDAADEDNDGVGLGATESGRSSSATFRAAGSVKTLFGSLLLKPMKAHAGTAVSTGIPTGKLQYTLVWPLVRSCRKTYLVSLTRDPGQLPIHVDHLYDKFSQVVSHVFYY